MDLWSLFHLFLFVWLGKSELLTYSHFLLGVVSVSQGMLARSLLRGARVGGRLVQPGASAGSRLLSNFSLLNCKC